MNSFIISIIVFIIANATAQTVFAQQKMLGQMPGQSGLLGTMTIADVLKMVPRDAQAYKNPENAKLVAMLANIPSFVLSDQASTWIPISYQKQIAKELLTQKQQKTTPPTKPTIKQQTMTKQTNSLNGMLNQQQQLAKELSKGQNYQQQTTPLTKPMKKQLPITNGQEPTNSQLMSSMKEMAMQQAQMMMLMNKMLLQQITTPSPYF